MQDHTPLQQLHAPQGMQHDGNAAGIHEPHVAEVEDAAQGQIEVDLLGDRLHHLPGGVVVNFAGQRDGQLTLLNVTSQFHP